MKCKQKKIHNNSYQNDTFKEKLIRLLINNKERFDIFSAAMITNCIFHDSSFTY